MTSAPYEYARAYAHRRILEGTLPRTAALDASEVYDLEPWEARELADELEAEPSAGRSKGRPRPDFDSQVDYPERHTTRWVI